jgi:hypothetical protein
LEDKLCIILTHAASLASLLVLPSPCQLVGADLPFHVGWSCLFDGSPLCGGPIHAAAEPIIPRCFGFMLPFLPLARHAVMVGANWVKAMGVTIAPHVPYLFHLLASALVVTASIASAGIWVGVLLCRCKLCNCIGECFDLRHHCFNLVCCCVGVGCTS